ncbi:hypothetical protein KIPB_000134, partial [Kipferlia bialata]|eukprot:g134.t1
MQPGLLVLVVLVSSALCWWWDSTIPDVGGTDLLRAYNAALREIVSDGTWNKLHYDWFALPSGEDDQCFPDFYTLSSDFDCNLDMWTYPDIEHVAEDGVMWNLIEDCKKKDTTIKIVRSIYPGFNTWPGDDGFLVQPDERPAEEDIVGFDVDIMKEVFSRIETHYACIADSIEIEYTTPDLDILYGSRDGSDMEVNAADAELASNDALLTTYIRPREYHMMVNEVYSVPERRANYNFGCAYHQGNLDVFFNTDTLPNTFKTLDGFPWAGDFSEFTTQLKAYIETYGSTPNSAFKICINSGDATEQEVAGLDTSITGLVAKTSNVYDMMTQFVGDECSMCIFDTLGMSYVIKAKTNEYSNIVTGPTINAEPFRIAPVMAMDAYKYYTGNEELLNAFSAAIDSWATGHTYDEGVANYAYAMHQAFGTDTTYEEDGETKENTMMTSYSWQTDGTPFPNIDRLTPQGTLDMTLTNRVLYVGMVNYRPGFHTSEITSYTSHSDGDYDTDEEYKALVDTYGLDDFILQGVADTLSEYYGE